MLLGAIEKGRCETSKGKNLCGACVYPKTSCLMDLESMCTATTVATLLL